MRGPPTQLANVCIWTLIRNVLKINHQESNVNPMSTESDCARQHLGYVDTILSPNVVCSRF